MILIIGPNGVGKTKIAYELARRLHGEIINLDRTYLYRDFPLTTGQQDALKEQGVKRHLYGLLDANDDSFTTPELDQLIDDAANAIERRGSLAIAEGGSTKYIPDLLAANQKRQKFALVVGLRPQSEADIERRYLARINEAIENGLLDEIVRNRARYEHSFIMTQCHFAVPMIRYLNGQTSLSDAKDEVVRRCLAYRDLQMSCFDQFDTIRWVDATNFEETYTRIEQLIKK